MVGWSELFGFEMVLARISGFVLFSPILGRSNIPGYAKTGLILVLSVFVYGLGQPMPAPPGTVVELVVRLGVELIVGFVLGFLMQLCAAIVQAGGEIIDAQMGLTMAQIYDASSQANMSVTASLLNILFFLNFFAENGHYTLMRILLGSAEIRPLAPACPRGSSGLLRGRGVFLFHASGGKDGPADLGCRTAGRAGNGNFDEGYPTDQRLCHQHGTQGHHRTDPALPVPDSP